MIAASTIQNNLSRLQITLSFAGNTQGWKQVMASIVWAVTVSSDYRKPRRAYMWAAGSSEQYRAPCMCSETAHKLPERRLMVQTSAISINPAGLWFGDSIQGTPCLPTCFTAIRPNVKETAITTFHLFQELWCINSASRAVRELNA